jgi:hypothetical protein
MLKNRENIFEIDRKETKLYSDLRQIEKYFAFSKIKKNEKTLQIFEEV